MEVDKKFNNISIFNFNESWVNVEFDDPSSKNALSENMINELNNFLDQIERNDKIRGISFKGSNAMFCSGANLKEINEIFEASDPKVKAHDISTSIGKLLKRIQSLPQVTIMIVEGAAMAGGFGIMCAGDISIVHSKAKFSLAETMIGLTPAQISPYVIKKAGFANAKKLMITAERFTGVEAKEYKLADYLFNSMEELNEIEKKLKKQILHCAPRAITETKKILDLAFERINQDFIDYASKNFVDQIVDGEGREGILSFVEKRKPNWKK
jgi:isohexenylglutaconyl-CoA hydratase